MPVFQQTIKMSEDNRQPVIVSEYLFFFSRVRNIIRRCLPVLLSISSIKPCSCGICSRCGCVGRRNCIPHLLLTCCALQFSLISSSDFSHDFSIAHFTVNACARARVHGVCEQRTGSTAANLPFAILPNPHRERTTTSSWGRKRCSNKEKVSTPRTTLARQLSTTNSTSDTQRLANLHKCKRLRLERKRERGFKRLKALTRLCGKHLCCKRCRIQGTEGGK